MRIMLLAWVSNQQVMFGEERDDPLAAGSRDGCGKGHDLDLGNGCVAAEPGEQDPQRPGGFLPRSRIPPLVDGERFEFCDELLRVGGQRGQLGRREGCPVAPHIEQRLLSRVNQARAGAARCQRCDPGARDRGLAWCTGAGL